MDLQNAIAKGRAIKDLIESDGWQIFKEEIEKEIAIEQDEILDCPQEEYPTHRDMLKAYKKVLGIVDKILEEKEEAERLMRK